MDRVFLQQMHKPKNCYNLESKNALPVLLIHGWNEGEGGEYEIHLNNHQMPVALLQIMLKNLLK